MLKNLSPLLSGPLLSVLDEMSEGQTLTLVGRDYPSRALVEPIIDLGPTTAEAAVDAILTVLPLDAESAPIAYLDAGGDDLPDTAYAVGGLARDAELRSIDMVGLSSAEFASLAGCSVATVRVDDDVLPSAFVFRKGMC